METSVEDCSQNRAANILGWFDPNKFLDYKKSERPDTHQVNICISQSIKQNFGRWLGNCRISKWYRLSSGMYR